MLKPPNLIREIEVDTVGDLRRALTTCPDTMPVSDSAGELLCLRFYEEGNKKFLEVA